MKRLYSLMSYKSVNLSIFRIDAISSITLTVRLTRTNKDGFDKFFYYESESKDGNSIYIDLNWSIIIRKRDDAGNYYMICDRNHYQTLQAFKTVKNWLVNDQNVFISNKKGEINKNRKYQSIKIANHISQSIELDPCINNKEPFIGLSINDSEDILIPIGVYLNMCYALESVNPYVVGTTLLMGINTYNLEEGKVFDKPVQSPCPDGILAYLGATRR